MEDRHDMLVVEEDAQMCMCVCMRRCVVLLCCCVLLCCVVLGPDVPRTSRSGAEQGAEQSRAEQSRAEQSRARRRGCTHTGMDEWRRGAVDGERR